MNIFQAAYKAQFSVLAAATRTYLTVVIAIVQTLIVEVAETTAQAGYDRADWFYGVWAEAHYAEMPETQPVDEVEPDYWFEPLETFSNVPYTEHLNLGFEPLETSSNVNYGLHLNLDFKVLALLSASSTPETAPTAFVPFGLLAPGAELDHFHGMTIRELRAVAKQRGIKKYGSMPKARLLELL